MVVKIGAVSPNEERKSAILELAMKDAVKWAAVSTVAAGILTFAATRRFKGFRENTSISIKTAIPVMTGLGMFSFRYETTVNQAQLHPERFGLVEDNSVQFVSKMPLHHKFINYLYDHPFQLVASLGAPLAATIAFQQRHNHHLSFSQKVMHSRVFAQGGVISILLITMAFREYMDRNGRFLEPGEVRKVALEDEE